MIKAIFFDCFGVLTTSGFRVFVDEYFPHPSPEREKAKDLMDLFNVSSITFKELVQSLAQLSKVPQEKIIGYLDGNKANKPLFDYIKTLKSQYKIGILSNSGGDWLDKLFTKEDVALFDDIVLSYQHGLIKPDPEIFLLAAQRLSLHPQECVFVDDNAGHCQGAQAVGMQTVKYDDFPQMKKDLEEILSSTADH